MVELNLHIYPRVLACVPQKSAVEIKTLKPEQDAPKGRAAERKFGSLLMAESYMLFIIIVTACLKVKIRKSLK